MVKMMERAYRRDLLRLRLALRFVLFLIDSAEKDEYLGDDYLGE
jgi:hypothetical protein